MTCLGAAEVTVRIRATEPRGTPDGRLVDVSEVELEGFQFLCDLDPVFTLRFAEGSAFDVVVTAQDGRVSFQLAEYAPDGSTRYSTLPQAGQALTGRVDVLDVLPLAQVEIDGESGDLLIHRLVSMALTCRWWPSRHGPLGTSTPDASPQAACQWRCDARLGGRDHGGIPVTWIC